MVTTIPTISDDSKFTATALATMLGVSTETIRRYRKAGKLKARMSRANGRYFFTGREIKRFWQVL